MPINPLSVKYLTKKGNAVEGVKNLLRDEWPNLTITQTSNISNTLSEPRSDVILIDAQSTPSEMLYELASTVKKIPLVVASNSKKIFELDREISENNCRVLSQKEFKSEALIHVIKHLTDRKELLDKLNSTTVQLRELAVRDDLTNLYNKRYIDDLMETEFKKAGRYKVSVSALIIGIDCLKNINNAYGYEIGNRVLTEFAQLIQNAIREVDAAARIGGDEFIVILPSTDLESAIKVACRIQNDVHKTIFASGKITHNPTASIGIAEYNAEFRTPDEWKEALRKSLIEAKHSGKDQIKTILEAESSKHPKLSENTEIISDLQKHITRLTEDTKNRYFKGILELIETLPFYKKFIVPHSERVAFYAEKLALKAGMDSSDAAAVKRAGLIHDIGKVAIDKKILLKSMNLNHNEFNLLTKHPIFGIQIVGNTIFLKNEQSMILHHHERFDGNGYPDKIKGTHIPLGARVLSIAEAWDTMTSDQAYRPAISLDKAISEIKRNAGIQFDPDLATTFTAMIEG